MGKSGQFYPLCGVALRRRVNLPNDAKKSALPWAALTDA